MAHKTVATPTKAGLEAMEKHGKPIPVSGHVPLSEEDIAQMQLDEIAHNEARTAEAEDVRVNGHRYARKAAFDKNFPSGDQLDEIWKAIDALSTGKPAPQSALDMLAGLKKVKSDNPPPA